MIKYLGSQVRPAFRTTSFCGYRQVIEKPQALVRRESTYSKYFPFIQMALPLIVPVSFFIFTPESVDINNPEVPAWFKIFKDLSFLIVVFAPFLISLMTNKLRLSLSFVLYLLIPLILTLIMICIGSHKFDLDSQFWSLMRNSSLYYVGAGAVVILAYRFDCEMKLFQSYRKLMAFSVFLGLIFYLLPNGLYRFAMNARMIGTVGNPNFMGYFCFLNLVLIHGFIGYEGRIKKWVPLEMLLAYAGLIASASVAAVASYAVWFLLFLGFMIFKFIPFNKRIVSVMLFELFVFLFVVAVGYEILSQLDPVYLQLFRKLTESGAAAESIDIRAADYSMVYEEVSASIQGMLIGSSTKSSYLLMDGAMPNLIYNFGLPFFIVSFLFFILPLFTFMATWKAIKKHSFRESWLVAALSLFIVTSVGIHFWVQMIPQIFPACFIFAWIINYLFLRTTSAGRFNASRNIALA